MSQIDPSSITWTTGPQTNAVFTTLKSDLGTSRYESDKQALKKFLCGYFESGRGDCTAKQGPSVSPLGGGPNGWKRLKVRWAFPGCGKSGGLRLAVMVHCRKREVIVAGAWRRKVAPTDEELTDACKTAGV